MARRFKRTEWQKRLEAFGGWLISRKPIRDSVLSEVLFLVVLAFFWVLYIISYVLFWFCETIRRMYLVVRRGQTSSVYYTMAVIISILLVLGVVVVLFIGLLCGGLVAFISALIGIILVSVFLCVFLG